MSPHTSPAITHQDIILALRSIAEHRPTCELFDNTAVQIAARMLRARTCSEHGGVYIWGIPDELLAKMLTAYFKERQAGAGGASPSPAIPACLQCNDTGQVHDSTCCFAGPRYRTCTCPAGDAWIKAQMATAPVDTKAATDRIEKPSSEKPT